MNFRIALMIAMLLPAQAQAHASLTHADPAVGSTVQVPPAVLRLVFSEALDAASCRITVLDADGHNVTSGSLQAAESDASELDVPLKSLVSGRYRVRWKAVSTDAHVTHGSFEFKVVR